MTKSKYIFKPSTDYLKYWRVIRYYIRAKHNISTADLDILLFLYSEEYFSKDKFNEFDEIMSWDVNRFDRLLRDNWIVVFRKRGKEKAMYEISYKGRRVLGEMYKKLGGEVISENRSVNPLFLKGASYQDKVYKNMIIQMNAFIRQQRHLSRQ
jgi:hypothetical protein